MQLKNGQANIYNGLTVAGSTAMRSSGSTVLSIDGISGRLFSVDDSLSGSLFSVNTAAGLPVMEAFSDNSVRIGQYGTQALFVSRSRVGIGKESGINANLDILGTAIVSGSVLGSPAFYVTNGGVQFGSTTGFVWDAANSRLGIGTSSPGSTLDIKGAGATSATNALVVQNSSSTNLLFVRNDGLINIGSQGGNGFRREGSNQTGYIANGLLVFTTNADNTNKRNLLIGANLVPNYSAMLQLDSTSQGFLPPRMTTTQKNAISSPAEGLVVYDTDTTTEGLWYYSSGSIKTWQRMLSSSGSQVITGSLNVSGLTTMVGSGSSLLTIDGVSGRLFQVDDSLSGSLFSVNNSTGLPLIEAFSDDTIRMGQFGTRALFVSQSRVGIGTETPTTKLDVSGSSRFVGNISVTGSLTATVPTVNTYLVQGILNADFSVSASSDVVIPFVDQYDPNNWYDAGTYRCTPTVAGYYMLSIGAWFTDLLATGSQCNIQSRKNNSTIIIVQSPTNNSTGQSLTGTKLVYMNGTTDYLDFTAYQSTATAKNLIKGTSDGSGTWFSLHLLTM